MTNVFYDCEFHEDGDTIDLISIGMVSETGETLYKVSNEFDSVRVLKNQWLMDNVMPSIEHEVYITQALFEGQPVGAYFVVTDEAVASRGEIAQSIVTFLSQFDNVDLWAWYGAYDHVALAQLFGKMINLPENVPMFTNDIKTLERQAARLKGLPKNKRIPAPRQPAGLHNALEDAKHNVVRYNYFMDLIENAS